MLLCAGLGSRLGALGAAVPKPMLPVLDRPILEYGIANLRGHGITDLVINLHHRGDVIEQTLGDFFAGMAQRPGWAGMRAIKNKRVCVFTPAQSDTMVRPGPRMAEAAAAMARCLEQHVP